MNWVSQAVSTGHFLLPLLHLSSDGEGHVRTSSRQPCLRLGVFCMKKWHFCSEVVKGPFVCFKEVVLRVFESSGKIAAPDVGV